VIVMVGAHAQVLTEALGALGVGVANQQAASDPLRLANALLGVSEREIIEADMAAEQPGGDPDAGDRAELAADQAADWQDWQQPMLQQWRSHRLMDTLERAVPEDPGSDPVLAAARDAAALTCALLSYRRTTDPQFSADLPPELAGLPDRTLPMAIALCGRIVATLRELSR
jgi:hypothetical protein